MITHIARREGFDGLAIRDERGSSLVIERTAEQTQVWIAPPGENDGPGVTVSDPDRKTVADFLTAERSASKTWYATPEPEVAAVRDRFGRVWVRSTYETGPNLWRQGERGAGRPVTWHTLLGEFGPLIEAVEAVTAR